MIDNFKFSGSEFKVGILIDGKRMKVYFGEIIDSNWIDSQAHSKKGYQAITDELMEQLTEELLEIPENTGTKTKK